jgi:hypothetical protein
MVAPALAESELRAWQIDGKTVTAHYVGTSGRNALFRLPDSTFSRFPRALLPTDDVRFIAAYKRRPITHSIDRQIRNQERYDKRRARDKHKLAERTRVAPFYNARGNQIRANNATRNAMIARAMSVNPGFALLNYQIQMQNARQPIRYSTYRRMPICLSPYTTAHIRYHGRSSTY